MDFNPTAYLTCMALALLIAAKRAESSLPAYILFIFSGLVVARPLLDFGWDGHGGLDAAIAVYAVLALRHTLKRLGLWQNLGSPELCLGRGFILRTSDFIGTPLLHLSWILLLCSLSGAFYLYDPRTVDLYIAIALFLDAALLIHFALHYKASLVGALSLVPILGVWGFALFSVPFLWRPHVIGLSAFLLFFLAGWLNKRSSAVQSALARPVSHFNTGLAYLSIPTGLLGYLFLFESSYLGWVLYGLIALLYTHFVLLNRTVNVKVAVHLVLIHLGVVWSLCFLKFLNLNLSPGAQGEIVAMGGADGSSPLRLRRHRIPSRTISGFCKLRFVALLWLGREVLVFRNFYSRSFKPAGPSGTSAHESARLFRSVRGHDLPEHRHHTLAPGEL